MSEKVEHRGLDAVPGIYQPQPSPTIDELADRMAPEFRAAFVENYTRKLKEGKPIVMYADGCYDMFHFGHAHQLKQIKALNANVRLIIGVCGDEDINKNKGHVIMNEGERVETVKHCRWVDDIIFPAPWCPTLEFMDEHNIDFIAHDTIAYDAPGIDDVYLPMKKAGRFMPTLRTEGISTSDLLTRILKDREEYYERNLKKGISRKDLNLNYAHYAFIQMKGVFSNMQRCLKNLDYEKGEQDKAKA